MPSADEIRDGQRATWAGLSAGWEKWDSVIMEQLGPVGAAMIERLDIAEDQQHLDIAAGTGEPGLSIARLAPKGRVVLTDLVAGDAGRRRAASRGARGRQHRDEGVQRRRSAVRRRHVRQRLGALRVHVLPRHGQGDGRVRARARAGRTSLLVGLGQARGEPVDDDRHAGDRDRGGGGATRPGRAEHVPVRGAGIRQCPVRGRRAARRRRVGRRRRARDAIARAVLGDDQRARLARGRGAPAGRRTGAGADPGNAPSRR